jgi:hypothetical protein
MPPCSIASSNTTAHMGKGILVVGPRPWPSLTRQDLPWLVRKPSLRGAAAAYNIPRDGQGAAVRGRSAPLADAFVNSLEASTAFRNSGFAETDCSCRQLPICQHVGRAQRPWRRACTQDALVDDRYTRLSDPRHPHHCRPGGSLDARCLPRRGGSRPGHGMSEKPHLIPSALAHTTGSRSP